MKKKETIFIASILVIAGILWLGFRISGQRSHNTIRITVDGKEFGTYSLSKDQVIHIGDQRWKSYNDRSNLPGSLLYETEGS